MLNLIKKICLNLETIIHLLKQCVEISQSNQLKNSDLYTDLADDMLSLPGGGASELLDIQDVMKKLGISESTYYRFVRNGQLKPRKKGRRHYYYLSDLHAQLSESVRRGRI